PGGDIFAIAMIARARGQRQTRDDISLIFNAILRSRRVARVSPRTKYERCATSGACVRFETLAASEQSGLETCASVLLYSRTDITWYTGTEVCAEAKPNR
ncbi:MAG: hypothetical protein WBC72_21475, partial [Pseudolabrys sp.]